MPVRRVTSCSCSNAYIPEYLEANRFNHETKRPRRLLLHRKQINKLIGATKREGYTVVPLKIYFNEQGRAKIELGLGRGKKLHDKRESAKEAGLGARPRPDHARQGLIGERSVDGRCPSCQDTADDDEPDPLRIVLRAAPLAARCSVTSQPPRSSAVDPLPSTAGPSAP